MVFEKQMKTNGFDYELIDCGDFRRFERFGDFILERPCPQAHWPLKNRSIKTDAIFKRSKNQKGWRFHTDVPKDWQTKISHITAECRFAAQGQIGIFPEQYENWTWLNKIITQKEKPLKILNTFAHTGIATLFTSTKNTEVTHVDGAKASNNWGKRNAELSGFDQNKIRWICDDVISFMKREIRRENTYDGIILDPPAFGRGAKKDWHIERDLFELMECVKKLLTNKPLFVILTCHAPDSFSPKDLAIQLQKIPQFKGKKAETLDLKIKSKTGNDLPSSFGARISNN